MAKAMTTPEYRERIEGDRYVSWGQMAKVIGAVKANPESATMLPEVLTVYNVSLFMYAVGSWPEPTRGKASIEAWQDWEAMAKKAAATTRRTTPGRTGA